MPKPVVLLGGGGHGRVLLDALLADGVIVSGILDPQLDRNVQVFGIPVLGDDQYLTDLPADEVLLANGLGLNLPERRRSIFETLSAKGFSFTSVRHGSSQIARECHLGQGCQIMAGAVIQNRVRIGDNSVINTHASIDHDCLIGAHAFVGPGAILCGDVHVGAGVIIGAGAVVLPGIKIEDDAVVGAGSIVTKSVASGSTVVGNPAVHIRSESS